MRTLENGYRKQKRLAEPTRLAVLARNLRVQKKTQEEIAPSETEIGSGWQSQRDRLWWLETYMMSHAEWKSQKVQFSNVLARTSIFLSNYFGPTRLAVLARNLHLVTRWIKKMLARNKLALRAFLGPVRADASGCVGSKTHSRHRTFRAYKPIYLVVFCLGRRCCHMSKKR